MNEASNKYFMNEAAPSFPPLSAEFESVDPYISRITKLETHRAQLLAALQVAIQELANVPGKNTDRAYSAIFNGTRLIAEIEEAMK